MGPFSFQKTERLNKRKQIQELFEKGSSFYLPPFKVVFLPQADNKSQHQALFSVPARTFKRAVDRNLIKRRMREAYRLQKGKLPGAIKLSIAFIYTSKEILPFPEIHQKLILAIGKIHGRLPHANDFNQPFGK